MQDRLAVSLPNGFTPRFEAPPLQSPVQTSIFPMSSSRLQLVIFDFDGLIIDTESAILDAWKEIYALCRRPYPAYIFQQMIGRAHHPFDPWHDLSEYGNSPIAPDDLKERFEQIHRERIEQAPVLPGVIERLFEAKARGMKAAVASSSSHSWVDRHLKEREMFQHFDLIRCRDDVARAKPWPDLYLSVLETLQIPADRAVVFEDSHNGLTAARAGGIACVVIPNATTRTQDFAAATRVITSLEDFDLDS